jgi:hypothetical protein
MAPQPLNEYLEAALEESDHWQTKRRANRDAFTKLDAIRANSGEVGASDEIERLRSSIDKSVGSGWCSPTWQFARIAKGHPELWHLSASEAVEKIEALLGAAVWGRFVESDDPRVEFLATWDKIRLPGSSDILESALDMANFRPLKPWIKHSAFYCRFVSLAGHLQRYLPGQPIALPVERIAQVLGVKYQTVCNYRNLAVQDGLLAKVDKHVPHHKAATYLFAAARFDWHTGEQISLPSAAPTAGFTSITSIEKHQSSTEGTGMVRLGDTIGALFDRSSNRRTRNDSRPLPDEGRLPAARPNADEARRLLLDQLADAKKKYL